MGLPERLPTDVRLTARAVHDLESLLRKDPKNFRRVWSNLKRLAEATLPQGRKKLKGFEPPLWQVASGAFRIFFAREDAILWIRGVVSKPEQKKRLRAVRS